jgi:DNA-binding CsgD family transcriptional regulator
MNGSIRDDSSSTGSFAKEITMPNEGVFSVEASGTNFGLIPLENRIIALTVAGYSSEESAKSIGISEHAFHLHLTSICEKLRVSNQLELVLFVIYHHLVETNQYGCVFSTADGQQLNPTSTRFAPEPKCNSGLLK